MTDHASSSPHPCRGHIAIPRFTDPPIEFVWPVFAAFTAICFAVGYPGRLNQDSLYAVITISARAELGNWHSPTLAWLWSLPGPLLGQPAGALLVQSLLLGLYSGFLPRVPPTPRGWLALALALTFRLALVGGFGFIGKDIVVLGAMLVAIQLVQYRSTAGLGHAHRVALAGLVGLVLLIKAPNFLTFVVALALILPFFLRSPGPYAAIVVGALLVGMLSVPLDRAVDRHVFGAKDMHPDKQLVIFDLAGISMRTHSNAFASVAGWPTSRLPPIGRCYLPYMWDAFAPWGPCSGYSAAFDRLDAPLKRRWATEILAHPLAYAAHRLTYTGYLLRSQDHRSWGLGGNAVNDATSAASIGETREMMARLKADRPVRLWRPGIATRPFRWLEARLLRYPTIHFVAILGSLAMLLHGWLQRRDGVRLGALLAVGLGLGNVAMLVVFGVADPARYLLPTTCLFYAALLALIVPARSTSEAAAPPSRA